MANYSTTPWSNRYDSYSEAVTALSDKIDTIDTGKTLRDSGVFPVGEGKWFVAYLIYDT